MKAIIEVYFPKGYGFAKMTSPDGIRTNVFFHVSDIVSGDPVAGAEIEFDLGEGKNGKKQAAKNVRVLQPSALVAMLSGASGNATPQEGGKAGVQ